MRQALAGAVIIILSLAQTAAIPADTPAQSIVHVAPGGLDTNPGTLEKPLASLAGARDAVRKILTKSKQTGNIEVSFADGEYVFDKTVEFSPEDSGCNGFRVIYRSAKAAGSARFVGAHRVTGWQPHENGIWKKTGIENPVSTMHENGVRARYARFPNHKANPKYPGAMAPYLSSVSGSIASAVYQAGDLDPSGWTLTDQARFVWWAATGKPDWGQVGRKIGSIDAGKNTINLPPPDPGKNTNNIRATDLNSFRTVGQGDRYFIQNIYELLDASGEFFHDAEKKVLYYKPMTGDPDKQDIRVPEPDVLISIAGAGPGENVHHLTFSGLEIAYSNFSRSRGAVELKYCHEIGVTRCHLKNIGSFAIVGNEGAHHCSIRDCWIEHCGQGGIMLRNQLKRKEHLAVRNEYNVISNCKLHDLGEVFTEACANGGVMLWNANDCVVSHCDIFNNPRYAISLRGHYSTQWEKGKFDNGTHYSRNNVFEYIRACRVGSDSGDMAAVHAAQVNEPDGDCINTWRQIIVQDVNAHPSMKDYAPNGIFVDHPRSCQKQIFEDFEISGTQGKPFRDNVNPVQTFRNVSWQPGFDKSKIQVDRIGLTPEFPKEFEGKGEAAQQPVR